MATQKPGRTCTRRRTEGGRVMTRERCWPCAPVCLGATLMQTRARARTQNEIKPLCVAVAVVCVCVCRFWSVDDAARLRRSITTVYNNHLTCVNIVRPSRCCCRCCECLIRIRRHVLYVCQTMGEKDDFARGLRMRNARTQHHTTTSRAGMKAKARRRSDCVCVFAHATEETSVYICSCTWCCLLYARTPYNGERIDSVPDYYARRRSCSTCVSSVYHH